MRQTSRRVRIGSRALAGLAGGASTLLLVAVLVAVPAAIASAGTTSHAAGTAPCVASVSAGTGEVVNGSIIVGVTAGSTQITLDCNASSQAALAVEASLLSSISASNVVPTNEVDTSAVGTFAPSTDTNCPAGSGCETVTVPIPATYTAADPNANCPPTQAQINAGIFGCAVAAVTAQDTPVAGAEFLLQYASQATELPSNPTIAALQSTGAPGSTVNISDASGASGYWWADANQVIQAEEGLAAAAAAPTSCTAGAGYGDVPAETLSVLWYAQGSTTPLISSSSDVAISNNCYTGKDLVPPSLSGTITVPATAVSGTTYGVYLCELDLTPYPGSTTSACGPAVNGAGWISASFPFTVKAGVISQNLPVAGTTTAAASSHYSSQLATSGALTSVTYTQSSGSSKLKVSSSGDVTTAGALNAGTYSVSGTTSDASGDSGTFTFSLTVSGSLRPSVKSVKGTAVPGHLAVITVTGANFAGRPTVTAPGVHAVVVSASSTKVVLHLVASANVKRGGHTLTLHFSNHTSVVVHYTAL